MNSAIRDALFDHEMFFAQTQGRSFGVDHIRRVESTWAFSSDEVKKEIDKMLEEKLLEGDDYSFQGYFSATPKGKIEREKRWQEKGLRSSCLGGKHIPVEDQIIALVASEHDEQIFESCMGFHENTFGIYLWGFPSEELKDKVDGLVEGGFLYRGDLLAQYGMVFLTADGEIKYAKELVPKLGIIPPETILAIPKSNGPLFDELGLEFGFADNLRYRWEEALRCTEARAWLAASILYGSILENIFLSTLGKDISRAMSSSKAPKRKGRVLELERWTLEQLLVVAEDIQIIDSGLLRYGQALRDLRNLVHPHKQVRERSLPDEGLVNISKLVIEEVMRKVSLFQKGRGLNGNDMT